MDDSEHSTSSVMITDVWIVDSREDNVWEWSECSESNTISPPWGRQARDPRLAIFQRVYLQRSRNPVDEPGGHTSSVGVGEEEKASPELAGSTNATMFPNM